MANLVMGAMSNLIPKLYQLLEEEYHLQSDVKERISSLMLELELAQAALCKVAEVPWDQLDKPVQIWARLVRDASYDMEDVLDAFLVRVKGPDSTEDKQSLPKYLKKMTKFIKKSKDRRKISGDVKDIITHLQEVTERCRRYKVDDIVARPATASTIDPRLHAMYTQMNKLVGMDKSSGELMSVLQPNPEWGDVSSTKMKIVSIVGVGGLGKTTLAKVVYDKIKGNFVRAAFVPVGRNPDLKKILKDILIDLHYDKKLHSTLDERQLIDRLREFFVEKEKRLRKYDELLLKNHHKHPSGATHLPEVDSVQGKGENDKRQFKGSSSGDPKNEPDKQKFNKKQKPNFMNRQSGDAKAKDDTKCHRCGTFHHFAKECRTPKHLVALYQKSLKDAKQGQITKI